MSIREQTAWDDPKVLRTHRPPPAPLPVARQSPRQTRQAVPPTPARKGVGTQAGIIRDN